MGWDQITNTPNRQNNLASMERSSVNLRARDTELQTMLRDLAATTEAVNHLVDGASVASLMSGNQRLNRTAEGLLRELNISSRLISRESETLQQHLELAERFTNDYQSVRNERPAPRRSGRSMAGVLSTASSLANVNRSLTSRLLASSVPAVELLLNATGTVDRPLSQGDQQAMRHFINNYRR